MEIWLSNSPTLLPLIAVVAHIALLPSSLFLHVLVVLQCYRYALLCCRLCSAAVLAVL